MGRVVCLLASLVLGCVASPESEIAKVEQGLSTGLVISQLYGAGGNTGATYNADFVEIFNRGSVPASLDGLSIQYASAAGTTWLVTVLPSKTVAPGGYFLIGLADGTTGTALPATDASGSTNLAAANGRVALVKVATALDCGASCSGSAQVIDFVGVGTTTDHEGPLSTPAAPDGTFSLQRKSAGCTETDDNAADFTSGPVAPRNSATALAPCGSATVDSSVGDSSALEDSAATDGEITDTAAPADATLADGGKKPSTVSDLPSASTCAQSPRSARGDFALVFFAFALARVGRRRRRD